MNKILPNAPTGVRGVINGVEYPMKVKYVGSNGITHVWEAIWPAEVGVPTWEDFNGLRADKIPGHTQVTVDIQDR